MKEKIDKRKNRQRKTCDYDGGLKLVNRGRWKDWVGTPETLHSSEKVSTSPLESSNAKITHGSF